MSSCGGPVTEGAAQGEGASQGLGWGRHQGGLRSSGGTARHRAPGRSGLSQSPDPDLTQRLWVEKEKVD